MSELAAVKYLIESHDPRYSREYAYNLVFTAPLDELVTILEAFRSHE